MARGDLLADKGIPIGQAAEAAAVALLVIGTVSYTLHLVSIESNARPPKQMPIFRPERKRTPLFRLERFFFSRLSPDARVFLTLSGCARVGSGGPLPRLRAHGR